MLWLQLWSFSSCVKDVSWRRQEETVDTLQSAVSVSPFRLTIRLLCDRQTCRPTVQKASQRTAIQLPFFSFCDCNKSTLRKAILNFVCFYFMVITIVIVVPVDVFLFSQYRWLFKCKKIQYDVNEKKNMKKLEYLVSGLKVDGAAASSGL